MTCFCFHLVEAHKSEVYVLTFLLDLKTGAYGQTLKHCTFLHLNITFFLDVRLTFNHQSGADANSVIYYVSYLFTLYRSIIWLLLILNLCTFLFFGMLLSQPTQKVVYLVKGDSAPIWAGYWLLVLCDIATTYIHVTIVIFYRVRYASHINLMM